MLERGSSQNTKGGSAHYHHQHKTHESCQRSTTTTCIFLVEYCGMRREEDWTYRNDHGGFFLRDWITFNDQTASSIARIFPVELHISPEPFSVSGSASSMIHLSISSLAFGHWAISRPHDLVTWSPGHVQLVSRQLPYSKDSQRTSHSRRITGHTP